MVGQIIHFYGQYCHLSNIADYVLSLEPVRAAAIAHLQSCYLCLVPRLKHLNLTLTLNYYGMGLVKIYVVELVQVHACIFVQSHYHQYFAR